MNKVYDLRCDTGFIQSPKDLSNLSTIHPIEERFAENEFEQAMDRLSEYNSSITSSETSPDGTTIYEAAVFRVAEMHYHAISNEYVDSGIYYNASYDEDSKKLFDFLT